MKGTICLADVIMQVVCSLVTHSLVGGDWTSQAVLAHTGAVVPFSLICLALWRTGTGQLGWIIR